MKHRGEESVTLPHPTAPGAHVLWGTAWHQNSASPLCPPPALRVALIFLPGIKGKWKASMPTQFITNETKTQTTSSPPQNLRPYTCLICNNHYLILMWFFFPPNHYYPSTASQFVFSQKWTIRRFKGKEFIWEGISGNFNREVRKWDRKKKRGKKVS